MRFNILITFTFISALLFAQNSSVNKLNSSGQKIGRWEYYVTDTIERQQFLEIAQPVDNKKTKQKKEVEKNIPELDVTVCVRRAGNYNDGKKEGLWGIYNCASYNASELLSNTHIEYLNRNSESTHYKINETLLSVEKLYDIEYKNDKINGILRTYYPNGMVKSEITYIDGVAVGKCIFNDKTGKLKYSAFIDKNSDKVTVTEQNGTSWSEKVVDLSVIFTEWTNLSDVIGRMSD